MNRRELVQAFAAGIAVAGTTPAWASAPFVTRRRRGPAPDRLSDRILATPRAKVLDLVEPYLKSGLPWQDLESAVFAAGIREIEPRPVGFKYHAVLVTESVFQLADASPPGERLFPVLWNLDDLKASQERDVEEGDWRLAPPPDTTFPSKERAARELTESLAEWDAERADRAVVGALPLLAHDELFELLWPFALRDFHNIGHKPIFATHVERVLRRVEPERAQPALRALVYGLLAGAPGANVDEYRASRRIAAELPDTWQNGRRDPRASLAIAQSVRTASSEGARAIVTARLDEGLHPATVWDGLRLAATDLFVRQPGVLPVHPTTVTSAFHYVFRATKSDATRAVALLQAASWLPLYRDFLSARSGFSMERGGLDPLVAETDLAEVAVDDLFAAPSPEAARACLARREALGPFATALRAHLARGVREHHQPKYAAAILEDVQTADPRWHPALLAPALEYLPSSRTPSTALFERSRALVDGLELR